MLYISGINRLIIHTGAFYILITDPQQNNLNCLHKLYTRFKPIFIIMHYIPGAIQILTIIL